MDLNIETECLYCKYTYGLRVELLQSIEEMFYSFLRKTQSTVESYEHELWMKFFIQHARYRTVCTECANLIETLYRKAQKKNRLAAVVPFDDDDAAIILMSEKKKNSWAAHCRGISDRAKQIIINWRKMVAQTRNSIIEEEDPSLTESDTNLEGKILEESKELSLLF